MGTALTIYWLNLFSHRDVSQTALKASSMEYIPHDRRNMEPPDVQYRLCGLLYQNSVFKTNMTTHACICTGPDCLNSYSHHAEPIQPFGLHEMVYSLGTF